MQVLYPCCCGLDVHKKFVVACVLTTNAEGHVQKESRTFSTLTQDLLALLDWLHAVGCTPGAMESPRYSLCLIDLDRSVVATTFYPHPVVFEPAIKLETPKCLLPAMYVKFAYQ